MISIFHKEPPQDATARELYASRLQESYHDPAGEQAPEGVQPEETAQSAPAGPQASAQITRAPAVAAAQESTSADPFGHLVDQITPRLAEALTGTMREVHRLAASDQNKLNGLASAVEQLARELAALREQTEPLIQSERVLSLKVARMEARLREQEETQRLAEELGRRLDTHTESLRMLHAALQQGEEFSLSLRKTLTKLGEGADRVPRLDALPEGL